VTVPAVTGTYDSLMRTLTLPLVATSLAATVLLTACGAPRDEADSSSDASGSTSSEDAGAAATCDKDSLETRADGVLTIGTDSPAYEPWFVDDDPTNGKGYESAVAYAIAEQLGYAQDEVEWVTVPFNAVVSPGEKKFDFDVNQVSITEERRNAVDFSSGYYDVRQAVITNAGSPIDGATAIADLADAKLGAQVGTTSYNAIGEQIGSSQQAAAFDTNDQAVQALKNGQIDGIVVDLPTAYYMTAVQLDDGVIVGQLPLPEGEVEQFGAVLDKGSPLTDCVSQAVDALREDGTLDQLADEWLAQQGAPELS
jgi:polar amino acid transport system substrate-binding protein